MILSMLFVVASAIYNEFAARVTKYESATGRCVCEQLRISVVWSFFLLVPIPSQTKFNLTELIGLVILSFGVLLF